MKLVHCLLHLVQREGTWAGCGPAQSSPRCTMCNSPPINSPPVLLLVIYRVYSTLVTWSAVVMCPLKG